MKSNSAIIIVGLTCQPDKEERFNIWYNEKHIPDLLRFKGVRMVTRYKTLTRFQPRQGYPDVDYPAYVTIYELENPESVPRPDSPVGIVKNLARRGFPSGTKQ